MQSQNKRNLIIPVVVLGALVVALLIALFWPKKQNNQSAGQHVDPFSHETVSNPPGKAPDRYGSQANTPLYLGFDKLIDNGLESIQIQELEQAFYNYSKSTPTGIKQISIDVDHINTQHDPTTHNSPFDIFFNVQFDSFSVYKAKVEYTGLNDVHLLLSDSKNKLVFDSGVIGPGE